jgi:hypothetical protein
MKMIAATVKLKSISQYSQGKPHRETRKQNETYDEFEERTWRNRMHIDANGSVYIPPTAVKNSLSEAAQYLSLKIPGKRNATYTKRFVSGILVADPIVLPIKAEDVKNEWLFLPADGKRGSGSRVNKCFPLIDSWHGSVIVYILDDEISKEVFERHMAAAGSLIGIGRFRPSKNGFYGRFTSEVVKWETQ